MGGSPSRRWHSLQRVREIRLHDTLSGRAAAPRAARARTRSGIYACGPTVYGRVHVGNARPFVVFALLKRFLEHEGLEVTLVENVTDVNDKIYDAAREAGVPSAELAAEMTAHYVGDTDRLGLGRPDHEPQAAETIEPIVDLIADLIESGHAYAAGGDVYFRVASFGGYGKLSNRPPRRCSRARATTPRSSRRAPRTSRSGRRARRVRTRPGPRPGGRAGPGWHIECSAMAEQLLGTDFEIHGGGSDLVFPHHENEIAQTEAARGPAARPHLDAQRDGPDGRPRRWPSRWATSACCTRRSTSTGATRWSCTSARGHYRQPLAFSPEALAEAGRAVERLRELAGRLDPDGPEPPRASTRYAERFFDGSADDFNTPAARGRAVRVGRARPIAASTPASGWAPGGCAEMLHALGLEGLLDAPDEERPDTGRPSDLLERARGGPGGAGLRARGPICATSWPSAARRCATPPEGARLGAPRVIVYGRNPVREALRGRRAVRRDLGHAARCDAEPWLREAGARPRPTRSWSGCAARATTRVSAPRPSPTPTPTPGRCWTRDDALVVCLDEVQDPHNLGAVCRVAEAAGRRGRGDPQRRSAEVTPAACKASAGRGRASGRGARAQPGRLAGGGEGAGGLGLRRGSGRGRGAL